MTEQALSTLWLDFKNGGHHSLSHLYREYVDELYSYGMKISGNYSLVKDCIQETFIHLIDKRQSIQITPSVHLYLFKSLRNKIFEELRSINRKQVINHDFTGLESRHEKHAEQLIIEVEESESISKRIQTSIDKLTAHQREIIYLKYTEGFGYDKIAEVLQIETASARTLLYRALKIMKAQLSTEVLI